MLCPNCKVEMVLRKGKFGDFHGCKNYPRCKMTVSVKASSVNVNTEKKSLKRIKTPSDYQVAIFDWVVNGEGHSVIKATAGSGKTTVQENVCAILLEDLKVPAQDIIYLAFNSHVVKEAVEKGLPAKSTHQVGRAAIADYTKGRIELDENKVGDIVKNLIQNTWDEDKWMISPVCQIVSKLKNTLAPSDDTTLEKICDKFGIEVNGSSDRIFELVRQAMELNNKNLNGIDFDDMLYLPVKFKMPIKQYKWVLGDEVQDWNRAQIELIQKLVAPGGRVIAVGDENQCQPAGTKVLVVDRLGNTWKGFTTFKTVNIEDLKVGDEIVSYSTLHGCFIYRSKVNGISKRVFNGRMRKIKTSDGKEHSVTPNHFSVVRWKKNIKQLHIVYMMKKGDWFRIGTSRLFNKYGGLGPTTRMTTEKADCFWILGAFENRMDALIEEQFISYYYGIPQTRFYGFDGYGYEQPIIDSIFERILERVSLYNKATKCLIDYNREIEYPFYSKSDSDKFQGKKLGKGAKAIKITAANLMPEWMIVPSIDTTNGLRTSMQKLDSFVDFELELYLTEEYVYGLEVDKHHTYVANGILTGNSMYGFRGSAPDAMQRIEETFQATILPLSISYRNPSSHVDLINRVFPNIRHEKSPFAKQGEILEMSQDKMLGILKDGDLVICRNNAPLVEPVFTLIRQGIKATIRGRDIGKNLVSLVERFNVKSTDDLLEKLETYRIKEVAKLMKAEKSNQAQALDDKVATIVALSDGTEWTWQIVQKINEVFSDKKDGVIFSSIHKAKGDEAERVFILNPQLMPSRFAKDEESIQQEQNIMFVALSRSKDTLAFVGGPAPAAFESQAMWEEQQTTEEIEVIEVKTEIPVITKGE